MVTSEVLDYIPPDAHRPQPIDSQQEDDADNEAKRVRLALGQSVFLRRHSGAVEPGWTVASFDAKTRQATATRPDGEENTLLREVRFEELLDTNHQARQEGMRAADSFEGLYEILNATAGIPFQGTGKSYNIPELIGMIEQVRKGRLDIEYVPRAEGLREIVRALWEQEAAMRRVDQVA